MDTNSLAKAAEAKTSTSAVATTQKKPTPPAVFVKNLIEKRMADIKSALPSVMTPERFARIASTAVSANPKLAEACVKSPMTFLGAMMTAAQLGVEPNTPLGQAYLLPFNNWDKNTGTKVLQVQFQLGVYGVIDLAYRSGEVVMIDAQVVYEKDLFEYELGLNPKLRHVPYKGADRGKAIYYYGMFKTKGGATGFSCLSREDVVAHAKRFSKTYNSKTGKFTGPWETDFDAMAKKTVLLAALKYAPKKSDFARAVVADNSVKSEISSHMEDVSNDDVIDVDAGEVAPAEQKPDEQQNA
jgi:recombination protein RecT